MFIVVDNVTHIGHKEDRVSGQESKCLALYCGQLPLGDPLFAQISFLFYLFFLLQCVAAFAGLEPKARGAL